jgi:hypothetical protein
MARWPSLLDLADANKTVGAPLFVFSAKGGQDATCRVSDWEQGSGA